MTQSQPVAGKGGGMRDNALLSRRPACFDVWVAMLAGRRVEATATTQRVKSGVEIGFRHTMTREILTKINSASLDAQTRLLQFIQTSA